MHTSWLLSRSSWLLFFVALLPACGLEGLFPALPEDPSTQSEDPADCIEARSQGLAEPCCLAHAIDACGADLFCAAFDGRAQPTCYVEGSRLDGEECAENRHCASGGCNLDVGLCASMSGTSCTPEVGCAEADERCLADTCSSGARFETCEERTDCRFDGAACVDKRCVDGIAVGRACSVDDECAGVTLPSGELLIPACAGECLFANHGRCAYRLFLNPDEVCDWSEDGSGGWCMPDNATGFCRSEPGRSCTDTDGCAEWGDCIVTGTCQ